MIWSQTSKHYRTTANELIAKKWYQAIKEENISYHQQKIHTDNPPQYHYIQAYAKCHSHPFLQENSFHQTLLPYRLHPVSDF